MIGFSDKTHKLICQRHKREVAFSISEVTDKAHVTKSVLTCPKCFVTWDYTEELKQAFDQLLTDLRIEGLAAIGIKKRTLNPVAKEVL